MTAAATFHDFGVPALLVDVLTGQGIAEPTPIQAATLRDSLAGRDVLGRGRTGSGKTLAFALPLVARLAQAKSARTSRKPHALILAPTRELVIQIDAVLKPLARTMGLNTLTIFGGVGQNPQVRGLQAGVDILIACPGRLEDLISQGYCRLDSVQVTVLDEADHMADLGFLPGVRRLLRQTPKTGQRLLFSATLDKAIDVLVREFLRKPVTHEADSAQSPVAAMSHHVLGVEKDLRVPVLIDLTSAPGRTLVFTRTKHGAKALARQLNSRGVPAVDLHGNLSQNARTRNMDAFSSGAVNTLVATDVAARGIHVDDVALVIHADPPAEHKAYLHRSGRTARAGREGTVVTLMTPDQRGDVRSLAKAAGIRPTTTHLASTEHPVLRELAPGDRVLVEGLAGPAAAQPRPAKKTPSNRQANSRGRNRGASSSSRRTGAGSGGTASGSGPRRTGAGSGGTASGSGPRRTGAGSGSRSAGAGSGARGTGSGSNGNHSAANFSRRSR